MKGRVSTPPSLVADRYMPYHDPVSKHYCIYFHINHDDKYWYCISDSDTNDHGEIFRVNKLPASKIYFNYNKWDDNKTEKAEIEETEKQVDTYINTKSKATHSVDQTLAEKFDITNFDFKDGKGPVPAARHKNMYGVVGGWVAQTAEVSKDAHIGYETLVYENAKVLGKARVMGRSQIRGNATVDEEARITGNVRIFGAATIKGSAMISGNAKVYGKAVVEGNTEIRGDTKVNGRCHIYGYAKVYGKAKIFGSAVIRGNAHIKDNAKISGKTIIGAQAKVEGTTKVTGQSTIAGSSTIKGNSHIRGTAKVLGWSKVEDEEVDSKTLLGAFTEEDIDKTP